MQRAKYFFRTVFAAGGIVFILTFLLSLLAYLIFYPSLFTGSVEVIFQEAIRYGIVGGLGIGLANLRYA